MYYTPFRVLRKHTPNMVGGGVALPPMATFLGILLDPDHPEKHLEIPDLEQASGYKKPRRMKRRVAISSEAKVYSLVSTSLL